MKKIILLILFVSAFKLHGSQNDIGIFKIELNDTEFGSFFYSNIKRQIDAVYPEEINKKSKIFDKDSLNNIFYIGEELDLKYIVVIEVDKPKVRCSYSCFMPFSKRAIEEMSTYIDIYSIEKRRRVYEGEIFTRASTKGYFITENCDRLHTRAKERASMRENNYKSTVNQINELFNDIGIK